MEIEDHKRVTCAVELLEDDARIWWGVIAQLKDVHTMPWTELHLVSSISVMYQGEQRRRQLGSSGAEAQAIKNKGLQMQLVQCGTVN